MFQHLLLPVDLTNKHAKVVQTAMGFAQQPGVRVTLLHIIEVIPGLSRDEDRAFYDRLEANAQKHIDKIGQGLAAKNVSWQGVILYGQRVQEIVRYAQENRAELILLTSPTFDAAHPALGWASMSFKISVLSPIPVLLVKG